MSGREKRLASIVGIVAVVGLAVKVVYPVVIKPMFDVEDEVARLRDDLLDLQEERDRVDDELLEYKRLVERTGTTDPLKVKNRLQEQLESMLREAGLESQDSKVTPRNPRRDRKTGVHTVALTVTAEGKLRPIVEFLKKCYELPYVARFKDVKLSQAGSRRGKKASGRIKLSAVLEVKVLPKHPLARGLIDFDSLQQPQQVVKHCGDSYAMIWDRKPFSEYVKPTLKPKQKPKPKKIVVKPKKSKRKPRRDTGDRDRKDKYIAGVLRGEIRELLVVNAKKQTRQYVAQGDKLDGGRLLYVHPYGGIVRRGDGDYFYELGSLLSEAVPVNDAVDIPGLELVAMHLPDALPFEGSNSSAPISDGELDENAVDDGPDEGLLEEDESGEQDSPDEDASKQEADPGAEDDGSAEAQVKPAGPSAKKVIIKKAPQRETRKRINKPRRGRKSSHGRRANKKR